MVYYRTAVFKVHDPTGRKFRRLKKMQRCYSDTYSEVLWSLKGCEDETLDELASAGESRASEYFKWLIGDQPLQGAMWSGLIEDVQQLLETYLGTPDANFPAPSGTSSQSPGELLDQLLEPIGREEEEALKAELKRSNRTYARPINFARYRDNPIICSEDGEKLWVAPHLQEREDGKSGALPPNGCSIRDTWSYSTGSYHWKRQANKETLPIELSRWHMHRFFREGKPTSSKLHVINGAVYVYYSFEFEVDNRTEERVLGVDRGRAVTAAYSVVDPDGSVVKAGSSAGEKLRSTLKEIDEKISQAQARDDYSKASELWDKRRGVVDNAIHRIANKIVREADRHNAVIAFEDLENLGARKSLKKRQYSKLAELVAYKAEEKALWGDVEVYAAHTSQTCGACGYQHEDNRTTRAKLECKECGHEAHADLNAARTIAIRAHWQISGGESEISCKQTRYTKMLARRRAKGRGVPEHNFTRSGFGSSD